MNHHGGISFFLFQGIRKPEGNGIKGQSLPEVRLFSKAICQCLKAIFFQCPQCIPDIGMSRCHEQIGMHTMLFKDLLSPRDHLFLLLIRLSRIFRKVI